MKYLKLKNSFIVFFFCFITPLLSAQWGYNIAVKIKCNDTIAFLTYYQMDKTYIKDTCTNIKDGKIVFKGKEKLSRGIYSIVNQKKAIVFDFFVDENNQNLKLESDANNFRREASAEN